MCLAKLAWKEHPVEYNGYCLLQSIVVLDTSAALATDDELAVMKNLP